MPGLGRRTFAAGEVLTASNVMGYLQDQAVMNFAGTAARGSAIGTAVSEGMVSYLADTNTIEAYNGSAWVNVASAGTASYRFVQTVSFTSTGSFSKASYPWLRAIRVRVQGAGGGGGGAATTGAGQMSAVSSGSGGSYAESFITDIAGLAGTVTVTVGTGGAGGVGGNNGANGGDSSFGSLVIGQGGLAGSFAATVAPYQTTVGIAGQTSGTGDLVIAGGSSEATHFINAGRMITSNGGSSFLGEGGLGINTVSGTNGNAGVRGGGGSAGGNTQSQGTARNGGAGGNGLVLVELFA